MTTSRINTVTLDTNVFPAHPLIEQATIAGVRVAVITVSRREVEGSSLEEELSELDSIVEVGVFGESRLGEATYGTEEDSRRFERVLRVLSNGAFPKTGRREALSHGQRRQLRDAMILCAHLAAGRDVLVSNDQRAFVYDGRREAIKAEFGTTVMTVAEFEAYLAETDRQAV